MISLLPNCLDSYYLLEARKVTVRAICIVFCYGKILLPQQNNVGLGIWLLYDHNQQPIGSSMLSKKFSTDCV